jgi:nucleoid DNA-binding protein
MALISKDKLFKDVSSRANNVDIDSVRIIYYALLKTIIMELDKSGSVTLPNFGRFYIVDLKEKEAPGLNGEAVQHFPARKKVRFKDGEGLQKYFNKKH